MKKLNRHEIAAIAARIQNNINEATEPESVESVTKRIKQTEEYKEISKLKSNSSVRKALELIGRTSELDNKHQNLINNELRNLGYKSIYTYINGKSGHKYTYQGKDLTNQIKNDITLEQLMCDDLQDLINKVTKKYL